MTHIRLKDSNDGLQTELSNIGDLDMLLDQVVSKTNPDTPTIIFVYAHGYQLAIGLGNELSFVHIEQESGEPPYLVTVGDPNAQGVLAFYLFEVHHTEIDKRNLIPTTEAREIIREFIQTGERSKKLQWEEV